MADSSNASTNRWIVLLNKSPKGPLSSEEVKALIDQGLLRLNDLAFEVSSEGDKKISDWKLLWQFPEFNRRGAARPEDQREKEKKAAMPAPVQERREPTLSETEAKQKVAANLPADLADIEPGDLVSRPGGMRSAEMRAEPDEELRARDKEGSGFTFGSSWIYGGAALGFVVFAILYFSKPVTAPSGSRSAASTSPSAQPPPPPAHANGGHAPTSRPASPPSPGMASQGRGTINRQRNVDSSPPPPTPPREREESRYDAPADRPPPDRGEIAPPRDDAEEERANGDDKRNDKAPAEEERNVEPPREQENNDSRNDRQPEERDY